jgi:hypothetical protein
MEDVSGRIGRPTDNGQVIIYSSRFILSLSVISRKL